MSECSFHRILKLRLVLPIKFSLNVHIYSYKYFFYNINQTDCLFTIARLQTNHHFTYKSYKPKHINPKQDIFILE